MEKQILRAASVLYAPDLAFSVNASPHWFAKVDVHSVGGNTEAKQAVLTGNNCEVSYVCLQKLVEKLMQDVAVQFATVSVELKEVSYKIITKTLLEKESNAKDMTHCALRNRSTTLDRSWIIDLPGAQCGINEYVYAWKQYESSFLKQVLETVSLDKYAKKAADVAARTGGPSVLWGLPLRAGKKLWETVDAREQRHQDGTTVLFLTDDGFEQWK